MVFQLIVPLVCDIQLVAVVVNELLCSPAHSALLIGEVRSLWSLTMFGFPHTAKSWMLQSPVYSGQIGYAGNPQHFQLKLEVTQWSTQKNRGISPTEINYYPTPASVLKLNNAFKKKTDSIAAVARKGKVEYSTQCTGYLAGPRLG